MIECQATGEIFFSASCARQNSSPLDARTSYLLSGAGIVQVTTTCPIVNGVTCFRYHRIEAA